MTKQRRLRPSQGGKMDRTSGPAGGVDPSDVPDDIEAAGDVHVTSRRQIDALRDWGGFIDPKDVKHAEFHRVEDALARPFAFERFTLRRDTPSGPVICGYEKSDDAFRALAFHSDQGDIRPLFVVDRSGAIFATSRVWNG